MEQRAPDGKPSKFRRTLRGRLLFVLLLVVGLLAVRALGPGGSPGVEKQGESSQEELPVGGPPCVIGRVLDSGGRAVAGASVEVVLKSPDGSTSRVKGFGPTATDGSFKIEWELGEALSRIRAFRGHLTVEQTPEQGDGDLHLPATFPVSGRIMAAEDGRPLEGMEVRLGDRVAKTDERGRFSFGEIPGDAILPDIEVKGAGRKPLRRALPAEGGLDDLHLSVEGE